MFIICINGSINSGKSTIAQLLATRLPDARFVEGDDHDGHDLPFDQMIAHAVRRLAAEISEANETLVVAYPLREEDYTVLRDAAAGRGLQLRVITLSPPLDVVLGKRGARDLSDGERARIREMYDEGYQDRRFSDLVITGAPTPDVVVETIVGLLGL
jgi:hypothetical protein